MVTIGIELNHVVRNINKQLLKYYQKAFDQELEIDDIDDKTDVIKDVLKFDSESQKWNFMYVDYPYEIFGCANTMEKNLGSKIVNWVASLEDYEGEDVRAIFYSLDEGELSIQSTLFFLSKVGSRVREVIFPKSIEEVYDKCDVIISARKDFFREEKREGKKCVLIKRELNKGCEANAFLSYDNLSSLFEDKEFLDKITKQNN